VAWGYGKHGSDLDEKTFQNRVIIPRKSTAEDVVQNTFIEAVRCADRFSGLSKPSTWLFGIALNLAHNQVRRNTADMSEAAEENFFDHLEDFHANPAVVVEQRQTATHIERLLNEMPKKIRDTFLIVLEGDCTYEQAAEQMQVPIGTIRSRVSRVRSTIRNRFDEKCPASPVTKGGHQKKARHCDALLAISTTASSKARSL
jgi:RNA polymerase sigma factor (sigma-70 family)